MLQTFTRFFKERNLSLTGSRFLLAVSGGIDSAVLCQLGREAGLLFAIVHCNFGLRGEESNRDEAFVNRLGELYGVPVFVKKFDTEDYASSQRISIQEAARNLRYSWFEEIRRENGFAFTLLAHHANDNIETVLMNFFRGTGLEGLTGMPEEKNGTYCLRPMLAFKRTEIEAYANEKKLAWVEDSSNASSKYTRNFFRNDLIPQVKNVFPKAEENLLRNIRRFQQTNTLYLELVQGLKKKVCEVRGEEVHIPVLKLMKYKDTSLIFEIIRDFGFGENYVDEVVKLADAVSGKYIANEKYRIIRHRAWFIIAPITVTARIFVIEKTNESIRFEKWEMLLAPIRREKFMLDPLPQTAQLDAGMLQFPMVLRKWKKGDYFYPLGMQKKKKLSRFFIDQKLSQTQKEAVWVLESHKRIVWVVGYRIDDRFKVKEGTTDVLQLNLSSL